VQTIAIIPIAFQATAHQQSHLWRDLGINTTSSDLDETTATASHATNATLKPTSAICPPTTHAA